MIIKSALLPVVTVLVISSGLSGISHLARAQENTLVIEGKVVNGTVDGDSVEELVVTLHRHAGERIDDLTAITGLDGVFTFENISFDSDVAYGVSVEYQGSLYGVDLDLSSVTPSPIEISIYEAVDDDSILASSVVSMLIADVDKITQTLWALEIVKINNDSDLTYVPGPNPMKLLRFGLPEGAEQLQVDTDLIGAEVLQVDRGFGITASVPPGDHEVMFAYRFKYSDDQMMFQKSMPFGAEELRLMVPDGSLVIAGAILNKPQTVEVAGGLYKLVTSSNISRGAQVDFTLSGLPQAGLATRLRHSITNMRFELVVPVTLGLLMVTIVIFALYRRRASKGLDPLRTHSGLQLTQTSPGNPVHRVKGDGTRSTSRCRSANQLKGSDVLKIDIANEEAIIREMLVDLDARYGAGETSDVDYYRHQAVLRRRLDDLGKASD